MPRLLHLPTAAAQLAEELDLVRWAIAQGFCTHDSLAASMGIPRSTLSMMLTGRRPGRFGLMEALRRHLDADQYAAVLIEQARRHGVDPGEVLRALARQQVRGEVWGEVADFVADKRADVPESVVPLRRARRRPQPRGQQLMLLKEAA